MPGVDQPPLMPWCSPLPDTRSGVAFQADKILEERPRLMEFAIMETFPITDMDAIQPHCTGPLLPGFEPRHYPLLGAKTVPFEAVPLNAEGMLSDAQCWGGGVGRGGVNTDGQPAFTLRIRVLRMRPELGEGTDPQWRGCV